MWVKGVEERREAEERSSHYATMWIISFVILALCAVYHHQDSTTRLILSKLDAFDARLAAFDARHDAFVAQVYQSFAIVTKKLEEGFRSNHDFGKVTARFLKTATRYATTASNGFFTVHYIGYMGKVFGVTIAHDQSSAPAFDCDGIDVALLPECPVHVAIDSSSYVPLEVGDMATALGYVQDNTNLSLRLWKGYLSGELTHYSGKNEKWFSHKEHVFQGATQVPGMSGAAAVNGCGYTGMAHAAELTYAYAVVIPAESIFKCAELHLHKFKSLEDCPVELQHPPRPLFSGCSLDQ